MDRRGLQVTSRGGLLLTLQADEQCPENQLTVKRRRANPERPGEEGDARAALQTSRQLQVDNDEMTLMQMPPGPSSRVWVEHCCTLRLPLRHPFLCETSTGLHGASQTI